MSHQPIPFLDLVTPHRELEEELVQIFRNSLHAAAFVGGPQVEAFEGDFAAYCESSHCIGVGSGTDALRFALIAVGVRPGETVVTVPNTFIATTEAISQAGGRIDFVDVDPTTYTMDPAKLRDYFETKCIRNGNGRLVHKQTGSAVAAVVPVHLYGQTADMDPILDLAAEHGLVVVEDACQAHGARYFSRRDRRWRTAGSMGRAAAFSFYPGKNLGACGEAGAITTTDEQLAAACRKLRDHGQAKKYFHDIEGYNGRLDTIQAGLLRVKLRHLDRWNGERRQRARLYDELLADTSGAVVTPFVPSWSRPVYHLYVVQVLDRDGLQSQLAACGIGTGIHYPIPLHRQVAYAHLGLPAGSFPVAEALAPRILSLPMFPNLTEQEEQRVAADVLRFASPPATASSCA